MVHLYAIPRVYEKTEREGDQEEREREDMWRWVEDVS